VSRGIGTGRDEEETVVRVSITITDYAWPGGPATLSRHLAEVVRRADDSVIDTVWVQDHLLQRAPGSSITDPCVEAYTTLGYLAGLSRRVRLGTMVSAATFRPPALLIKAVTTLDVLSGGRGWLGIGAGYDQTEAGAMGLPLPPVPERFDRLEETLRLARRMWAADDRPFTGRYHRLDRPVGSPLPLTQPHPPILIGGTGERRTLRLVAEYADACNLFDIPDGGRTIRHKIEVLAAHCTDVGRPIEEIERTVSTRLGPGEEATAFVERCHILAGDGIDHVVVLVAGPWSEDALATVMSAAAELHGAVRPSGRSGPSAHPEAVERPSSLGELHDHLVDGSRRLPAAQPGEQVVAGRLRPFDHHLDPAVGEVGGVADQAQFHRLGAGVPAETHALHVPVHERGHPDGIGRRPIRGRGRV
jgi:F420-dependent oxidoreductase-like protein